MGRYFWRCLLLMAAFALTTFGLLQWQAERFVMPCSWPIAEPFGAPFTTAGLHPMYYLLLGVILIPLSLWEIFLLEPSHRDHER